MASVQAAPGLQVHGASMTGGATKQQAEEVFKVCLMRTEYEPGRASRRKARILQNHSELICNDRN
jgi:hypothetical protein